MNNPLLNMMGGMFGNSGSGAMLQQIKQFAGMVGNRNPEQMVKNYMRQNNIPESELQNVMRQARDIARQFGIK